MSLHCFTIRALQPEPAQSAFNAFCGQQRVLRIERHLVPDGASTFWAVCVEVADGAGPLPEALKREARSAGRSDKRESGSQGIGLAQAVERPDYRHILPARDFAVHPGGTSSAP